MLNSNVKMLLCREIYTKESSGDKKCKNDERGPQKKENWRKMSQSRRSQHRLHRTESATRRKAKASLIFPEAKPLRKAKIRRTTWKRRTTEMNRWHTVARRSANAKWENGEGSSRWRVAESERRPDLDRRPEREVKRNGAQKKNGESPITSATPTYCAE